MSLSADNTRIPSSLPQTYQNNTMNITINDIESLREALLAAEQGRPWQWRCVEETTWRDGHHTEPPSGNLASKRYRAKPKPKPMPVTRPWSKPEDVPGPVCWLKRIGDTLNNSAMILGCSLHGVDLVGTYSGRDRLVKSVSWSYIASISLYSTDRINWHPCTVTEGAV